MRRETTVDPTALPPTLASPETGPRHDIAADTLGGFDNRIAVGRPEVAVPVGT